MCYNSRSIASSSLDIMSILGYGVFASFILSLILLTAQVLRARSFGRRLLYSLPEGDPRKGVSYALGRGMMPWEKESAAKHLPTYLGGVLYHAGVFAAVVLALCLAAGLRPPPASAASPPRLRPLPASAASPPRLRPLPRIRTPRRPRLARVRYLAGLMTPPSPRPARVLTPSLTPSPSSPGTGS